MRVAIYIRVSTKMQEDKYSLPAQRLELTRYAESMGWTIVDTFEDVDSGTKLDKEGLVSMLSVVERGLIDVVLFIEQDRLSRLDIIAWEYLKGILKEHDVKIAEPGSITDLSDSKDEFMSDLKNLFARQTRADLLEKMIRGKRQRTREGKVWGKQPEEYHYDKNTETLSINEDRAWLIPFIDELYLDFQLSTYDIATELNKRCLTFEGKKWTGSQVQQKLKRKAFHGVFERKFKSETIVVENVYPIIRTEETYEQIQLELKKRFNRRPAEAHFLRDIAISCACCKKSISVKKTKSYGKKEGQEYDVSALRHAYKDTQDNCEARPYINVRRIEFKLAETVKSIIADPSQAQQYIDSEFDEKEIKKLNQDIKRLNKQEGSLQEKIDMLLDLYLDGRFKKDQLDEKSEALDAQLMQTKLDIKERKRKRALIQNNQINYDTVAEFLSVANRYDQLLDEGDQQKLIGSLFPRATLDADNDLLILHASLPQGVTVDINVKIETMEETTEREMLEAAKKRHTRAQKYLNLNRNISLAALSRAMGSQPPTLVLDQERFGAFKYLAPPRQCPKLKAQRIATIQKELKLNPKATGRMLEQATGINRKMIYRLIAEEGLRA